MILMKVNIFIDVVTR